MRVTETMRLDALTSQNAKLSSKLMSASKQASTGIRVAAPSDDPVAYAAMARNDAMTSRIAARAAGFSRAQSDLTFAEGALAQGADLFSRARELAVSMADDGAVPSDRVATADEVHALRQQLIAFGNARGTDGYLFGGTQTQTPPFDATGAFVGNDNVMTVEVAEGVTAAGNASGAKAFTAAGGRDVLKDLSDLEAAMRANNPAAIRGLVGSLETSQQQITAARAKVGLGMERFASAAEVGTSVSLQLQRSHAGLAEVDAPSAYSALVSTQAAYSRSLDVTRQILALPTFSPRLKNRLKADALGPSKA